MIAKYRLSVVLALLLAGSACGDDANRQPQDAALDQAGASDTGMVAVDGARVEYDAGATACLTCHGSTANAAPPKDPSGNTATTSPGVGAHQQHLGLSTWHAEIACTECHVVPSKASYDPAVPTHLNGKDDLTWGKLAGAGTFDAKSLTCAGTYCHGATLAVANAGGTVNRTPVWNQVNGTWDACGTTCHTNPPGGAHPAVSTCESCHGNVVASFVAGIPPVVTFKDPSLHINGKVDLAPGPGLTCTTCHGDPIGGPAPPKGTKGETLTTQAAVGAHAQHLADSIWHRNVECLDCHVMPTTISHSNGKVDFSWGPPSNADGATPAFNIADNTCTNTYCHGSTLLAPIAGGTVNRLPVWTQVDGTQSQCGTTCHTNPPGGAHPTMTTCELCHGSVVTSFAAGDPPTVKWKNAALHINGVVDR